MPAAASHHAHVSLTSSLCRVTRAILPLIQFYAFRCLRCRRQRHMPLHVATRCRWKSADDVYLRRECLFADITLMLICYAITRLCRVERRVSHYELLICCC